MFKNRFKVFGSKAGSINCIEVKDAPEAVRTAKQMVTDHFQETYILDLDGKVHRSPDFNQLLIGSQARGAV
jgi:hypothetical protein